MAILGERSDRRRCGARGFLYLEALGEVPVARFRGGLGEGTHERLPDGVVMHARPDERTARSVESELCGRGIGWRRRFVGLSGQIGFLEVNSAPRGWIVIDREDEARARGIAFHRLAATRVHQKR